MLQRKNFHWIHSFDPPTIADDTHHGGIQMTMYRADHVGSFLRPAQLLAARGDHTTPADRLRTIEDQCILDTLRQQQQRGFRIYSDGELRRSTFMSGFNDAVEGITDGDAVQRRWSGATVAKLGIATGKLGTKRRMTKHEVAFLKAQSPGHIKITLPSANQFPAICFKKGVTEAVYGSYTELLWDCAPIIAAEVRALADDGVQYIQLDAPRYSYFIDPKWRGYLKTEFGMDPEAALDDAIRVDNAALNDVTGRPGLFTCIHLCRGNNRSQWYAEGGYDAIAEKVFNQLNVDAFSLEFDTPRSGTFEPLRHVPKGKTVVLGLISTKVGDVESADAIAARVDEAARYLPLEQLALSPQCGFASMCDGNLLSVDEQWRKMDLVAEVASRVWGTT
jgi:5-methyltetrahydropteroyltriglutamate--homocysteine methyltransferase